MLSEPEEKMNTRFTLDLGEGGKEELVEIATDTRMSQAEVVREAVGLYKILLERAKLGHMLFSGLSQEDAVEILLPSLRRAAKRSKK